MELEGTKIASAFVLFALLFSGLASASINPKIQLLNYTFSEVPAQPGHVIALTLHMKSMEKDNCAERVAVQLTVSYPLSVRGPDTQYIDSLCFRDAESKGDFTFFLPVDSLATAGNYPVSVYTTYEKRFTKLSETNTVNMHVSGGTSFAASVTSASPIDIYPGDSSQVTVTFDNLGSNMVTSARALAFTRGLEAKWAGSDQYIGSIAGHASGKAVFTLEAPKNLKSGNYPLEVRLEYVSSNKSNGWQEFSFTVPVKPKAEFSAEPANGALLPGQKKEVQLQLANTGTDEARKLQVRIKPLFPFSTDGTVRYVESLQPGEAANLTYLITVDKEAMAGGQLLSLQVDFEDKYGKKHSDSADFSMPVRMPTLVDDVLGLWYVEIPVALVVAYLLLRGRKRKATA